MNFLEWNNYIATHFFNSNHAGKDIHLFITKQEIINLVKENFDEETDQEIWEEFLRILKRGLPGSSGVDIFDKAVHALQQWKNPNLKSIQGVEIKYPPYIVYLVFTVLPLIEIQGDYYTTNYYDRLKDFLQENNISQNLRNKLRDIDELWSDLSHWSINIKNGELGCFRQFLFSHSTRRFVYKPFSQCVLTPKAIRRLPDFFYASGFVPKTYYQDDFFRQQLCSRKGFSILELKDSVIEMIKKSNDEIGKSIIETVKSEFNQWTGEEHEIVLKDGVEKKIRKNTVVPLKLQFKVNEDGEIIFSYRVKYSSEPPPELKFEEFDDIYENAHWSRTLKLDYKDSFELKDIQNKWKAVFDFKNIRLLIRGGYFQLGNDFFIETEKLSRVEGMYLLCKNNISKSVQQWGESYCTEFRDETNLINVPSGHSLFYFKNPQKSHEEFSQLKVYENKTILLRSGTGLKIGYLTYLDKMLPEIEVLNADGNEIVYLQYENSTEKKILQKHPNIGGIWIFPENILLGYGFNIQIQDGFIEGINRTYKIEKESCKDLKNSYLPRRNKFNDKEEDASDFIQGNNIQYSGTINKVVDGQPFSPKETATIQQNAYLNFEDNILLKWLVAVKVCDIKKFNEVFETVLHNTFEGEQQRVQERRKSCVNILDYLGYVEYNYSDDKIYTLPPKLISIPSDFGRKALLIGGRDEKLINEIIDYCAKSNNTISLAIKKQTEKNLQMLIPDSIILTSNNVKSIEDLATLLEIEFDEWYILKLKCFLPTLHQYEEFTVNKGSSESWEKFGLQKKVFSKESLKFELINGYDKNYSLTECRPSYIPEFALWINQSYYTVDKNWGKYLYINHSSGKEIGYGGREFSRPREIFVNSNTIFIPAALPLPKLFSRVIIQISGEAPDFKQLNLKGKNVWYNVYKNVPHQFTENFFRFILNMNIEKTTQAI